MGKINHLIKALWVVSFAVAPIVWAQSPATRPGETQATTRPTTRSVSLNFEIERAVERAQGLIRHPTTRPAKARNSLEAMERKVVRVDLGPLEKELVGTEGLIGFRVVDVAENPGGLPLRVGHVESEEAKGKKYVVLGEVDSKTATVLSDYQKNRIKVFNREKNTAAVEHEKAMAEKAKPNHRVWIVTNDEAVKRWGQGELHSVPGRIVNAELSAWPDLYVWARVVVMSE